MNSNLTFQYICQSVDRNGSIYHIVYELLEGHFTIMNALHSIFYEHTCIVDNGTLYPVAVYAEKTKGGCPFLKYLGFVTMKLHVILVASFKSHVDHNPLCNGNGSQSS